MLDEVDPIKLDHVHFGSELNCLYFFATNNWPYVGFGYTNDSIGYTVITCFKNFGLLPQNLTDSSDLGVVTFG